MERTRPVPPVGAPNRLSAGEGMKSAPPPRHVLLFSLRREQPTHSLSGPSLPARPRLSFTRPQTLTVKVFSTESRAAHAARAVVAFVTFPASPPPARHYASRSDSDVALRIYGTPLVTKIITSGGGRLPPSGE